MAEQHLDGNELQRFIHSITFQIFKWVTLTLAALLRSRRQNVYIFKILIHLDLLPGEKGWWARPPQELAEPLQWLLIQQASLEVPDPIGVVHLVPPPADCGGHVTSSGVPLHVSCHEVLGLRHDSHVRSIHELEDPTHTASRFISLILEIIYTWLY